MSPEEQGLLGQAIGNLNTAVAELRKHGSDSTAKLHEKIDALKDEVHDLTLAFARLGVQCENRAKISELAATERGILKIEIDNLNKTRNKAIIVGISAGSAAGGALAVAAGNFGKIKAFLIGLFS